MGCVRACVRAVAGICGRVGKTREEGRISSASSQRGGGDESNLHTQHATCLYLLHFSFPLLIQICLFQRIPEPGRRKFRPGMCPLVPPPPNPLNPYVEPIPPIDRTYHTAVTAVTAPPRDSVALPRGIFESGGEKASRGAFLQTSRKPSFCRNGVVGSLEAYMRLVRRNKLS